MIMSFYCGNEKNNILLSFLLWKLYFSISLITKKKYIWERRFVTYCTWIIWIVTINPKLISVLYKLYCATRSMSKELVVYTIAMKKLWALNSHIYIYLIWHIRIWNVLQEPVVFPIPKDSLVLTYSHTNSRLHQNHNIG